MNSHNLFPKWNALSYIPEGSDTVLDIGCNEGENLDFVYQLGVRHLRGIEINPKAVKIAKKRLSYVLDCQIFQGSADEIPIEDKCVDVILCCEVLEHIPAELRQRVIQEAYRVLRDGGVFIVTVPYNGIFSVMDPANMRFRLPRLYHLVSNWIGGEGRNQGFEGQKHGVVWHHHFHLRELKELIHPWFQIRTLRWRGTGVTPLLDWVLFPFYRAQVFTHFIFKIIKRIQFIDMSISLGPKVAYNVLLVLEKYKS